MGVPLIAGIRPRWVGDPLGWIESDILRGTYPILYCVLPSNATVPCSGVASVEGRGGAARAGWMDGRETETRSIFLQAGQAARYVLLESWMEGCRDLLMGIHPLHRIPGGYFPNHHHGAATGQTRSVPEQNPESVLDSIVNRRRRRASINAR